nr:unnamed protein product [Digitaria exilis]
MASRNFLGWCREFEISDVHPLRCHTLRVAGRTRRRARQEIASSLDLSRSRLAAGREHELGSPWLGRRLSAGSFAAESLPLGRWSPCLCSWELASP